MYTNHDVFSVASAYEMVYWIYTTRRTIYHKKNFSTCSTACKQCYDIQYKLEIRNIEHLT